MVTANLEKAVVMEYKEVPLDWRMVSGKEPPKRICVDLDGCVVEYDYPKIVKNFFGVDLSPQAIFAHDLADVLGVAPVLIDIMFQEQVCGKPNFIEGALETLNEWHDKRYLIIIYSNRVKYMTVVGLVKWLSEWKIPFEDITVSGSGEFDVHIDDSPGKLMGTMSKTKLLYTQPWNTRCLDVTKALTRVKSWEEIRNYV